MVIGVAGENTGPGVAGYAIGGFLIGTEKGEFIDQFFPGTVKCRFIRRKQLFAIALTIAQDEAVTQRNIEQPLVYSRRHLAAGNIQIDGDTPIDAAEPGAVIDISMAGNPFAEEFAPPLLVPERCNAMGDARTDEILAPEHACRMNTV